MQDFYEPKVGDVAPDFRLPSTRGKEQTLTLGRFEQTVTVPTTIDAEKIEARCENGLLRLKLPKAETARRRRIALQSEQTAPLRSE